MERVLEIGEVTVVNDKMGVSVYPSLLVFYGYGVAAMAGERYRTFARLVRQVVVKDSGGSMPLVFRLFGLPVYLSLGQVGQNLGSRTRAEFGVSGHLLETLEPYFQDYVPSPDQYRVAFHRFEYLNALVFNDLTRGRVEKDISWTADWAPPGVYIKNLLAVRAVDSDIQSQGLAWPPLKAGLFGGDIGRQKQAQDLVRISIGNVRREVGIYY